LGSVCNLKAGKAISSSAISLKQSGKNLYPCYGGNGIRGFVSSYNQNGSFTLIGRQGALCGNVIYVSGSFYATEHAIVVSHHGTLNERFLFYILEKANLNQYKTAGAQPGLSVAKLNKVLIPVPPLSEQERIVSILDKFDALVNDISIGLPAEIEARRKQYEYYRDKLLTFKEASK
jgi:type I restriction enzyme S subunit